MAAALKKTVGFNSLLPQAAFKLVSGKFRTGEMALPPQTAQLEVRIRRPTTATPLAWDANGKIRVSIFVTLDGVEYKLEGSTSGGIRRNFKDEEIPEYVLTYTPPWGKFGGQTTKRLGETGTAYTARIEVEVIQGTVDTEVVAYLREAPAPVVA